MEVAYTAKNFSGEIKGGTMKVGDERDLANQLRAEGFVLTSFREMKEGASVKIKFWDRFSTISTSEKMIFAKNLSVMISSGLPLSKSLQNLTLQTRNKRFAKVLQNIQDDIQTGATLADGLAKYPGIFNELFVNMIRVGEASGNLEEVLGILATQLEKEHELISKVKGALVYPSVILVAMVGIGIVMIIYVVPQITGVFKYLDAELPASTKFIILISDILRNDWIFVLVGFGLLIFSLRAAVTTSLGKKMLGTVMINTPVIKNIVIKLNCARFARIYSSLLRSGVSVVEALTILSRTLTSFYYNRAFKNAAEEVKKGINLSKIIYDESKIFPILVPQMIEVGEETGKTEAVLLKLAEFYEEEINQLTKNLSSVIEPVLMLIIGSAVGFFAISILQPMYSVLENIK